MNKKEMISKINTMAIPLLLNFISGLCINFFDQAMIGRISIFAYAAVGVVSTTIYSLTGILGMIAVAFNIIGAKAIDKRESLHNKFKITLILNLIIGIVFFIGASIFKVPILKLFYGLDGQILYEAVRFLNIYSLSLGINLVLFVFSSYFKIINKTKWIFYGALIANLCNLIFDYILIFGKFGFPKMGVVGNAIGTVLALLINVCIYLYGVKNENILRIKIKNFFNMTKKLVKLSIPLMGQEFLEGTLFVIGLTAIVSRLGVIEVSVFNLIFLVISVVIVPMHAYSTVALTLVSQEKMPNIKHIIPKLCMQMGVVLYFVISCVIVFFRSEFAMFVTDDIYVVPIATLLVPLAVSVQIFNYVHSIYKYVLQGVGQEKWVLKISTVINVISMSLIILLTHIIDLNLTGVYIGIGINYLILSVMFYLKFLNINLNSEKKCIDNIAG